MQRFSQPSDPNGPYSPKPPDPKSPTFNRPVHCLVLSKDDLVYVCDRANNRIQVFNREGQYQRQFVFDPRARLGEIVLVPVFYRPPLWIRSYCHAVSPTEVAEQHAEDYERKITPHWIGYIIRKKLGLKTESLAGTCVNTGCIPTK